MDFNRQKLRKFCLTLKRTGCCGETYAPTESDVNGFETSGQISVFFNLFILTINKIYYIILIMHILLLYFIH